ncbi:hypothetical protein F4677DRAFT_155375 [Hypoxylon crocopeplum]|nr:hypothetical protein F4677DRAFT_155375 [Hypoxylon crocopeplum]
MYRSTDVVPEDNATDAPQAPRQKIPVHITISDDRSKGSEFEQTRRMFIALEPRENKQIHSQIHSQMLSQNSVTSAQEAPLDSNGLPLTSPGHIPLGSPPATRNSPPLHMNFIPPTTNGGTNHALQDYQMQLMLLEQQNKKRLMMQRQEQGSEDRWVHFNGESTVTGPTSASIPPPRVSPVFSPVTSQRNTDGDLFGLGLLTSSNPGSYQPQGSAGYGFPETRDMAMANSFPRPFDDQANSPRSIDVNALGIPVEATTSLEAIQAYIANLQGKFKAQEKPLNRRPSKSQIIHRIVESRKNSRLYLDRPQWALGETNSRVLTSNLPVSSIPAYLERHPDIAFVVYRDYDPSAMKESGARGDEGGTLPLVKHTSEKIEPATADLSEALAKLLRYNPKPLFRDEPGAITDSKNLSAPYLVIYHGRSTMEAFLDTLPTQQRFQFQLLLDYVMSRFSDEYEAVDALLEKGKITYPYIKYLFMPGDLLVEGKGQKARAYLSTSWLRKEPSFMAISLRSKLDKWKIDCEYWEFDGSFSRQREELTVEINLEDKSELQIDELPVKPLSFLGEVADMLRRRGEMFWKCRFRHFVSYHEDAGRESHHSGDERFIIDLSMYRKLHKRETRTKMQREETFADDLGPELMEKDTPPDDSFLYLLPLTIKGYSLKRKKWLDLQVDRISEVVWNKDAFESLVLDRKTKRLIRALVSNQLEAEKSTDLISGKGNGLILLLHGGPGTGKTLTAESVAEIAEKPLYPVTCGDIGTEPEMVETYLESVLNLGKTWGCVVLLDEADVFLEQRSLEDLQRNALVSVFLRVLEYYDGILILTSNRVGTFDEAFKSRIQLALHYPNLSTYQRTQIWGNFISRLEKLQEQDVDFDDLRDHVEDLAKHKMNGREIRNAITTARQYAKWDKQLLNYELMKDIIETAGRFDIYIDKLNGGYSQDQLAEDEGLRLAKAV